MKGMRVPLFRFAGESAASDFAIGSGKLFSKCPILLCRGPSKGLSAQQTPGEDLTPALEKASLEPQFGFSSLLTLHRYAPDPLPRTSSDWCGRSYIFIPAAAAPLRTVELHLERYLQEEKVPRNPVLYVGGGASPTKVEAATSVPS